MTRSPSQACASHACIGAEVGQRRRPATWASLGFPLVAASWLLLSRVEPITFSKAFVSSNRLASTGSPKFRSARSAFEIPDVGREVGKFVEGAKLVAGVVTGGDDAEVPRDRAGLLKQIREGTQQALQSMSSRLDMELPPGFDLGLETAPKGESPAQQLVRADRELARAVLEMLQALDTRICVAFRNKKRAARAQRKWQLETKEGSVFSFPETKNKGTFVSEIAVPERFLAKVEELKCECLLVVNPDIQQLAMIRDLSAKVGVNMGIFLLNSRLYSSPNKKIPTSLRADLQKVFLPVVHYRFLRWEKSFLWHRFDMHAEEGEGAWIAGFTEEMIGGFMKSNEEVLRTVTQPSEQQLEEEFKVVFEKA